MVRKRPQSHSDATDPAKASKSPSRRGKRERAESAGDVSVKSLPNTKKTPPKVDITPDAIRTTTPSGDKDTMVVEMSTDETPEVKNVEEALAKPMPVMDVVVHRVRCLHFHPKPVLAMASTPTWSKKHSLLALSRENGHVELKSLDEKFRTLSYIAGYRDRVVTSLAWIKGEATLSSLDSTGDSKPLLVGASRDGSIFQVDFATQSFAGLTSSGGGGVFALESLSVVPGCERCVAAGCEDGAVRIFQYIPENETFLLISSVPSTGAAVISLACHSGHHINGKGNGLHGLTIFAAIADGTIRRYDCSSKNEKIKWKSTIRMTVESRGRNIPTRVWSLKALRDGTLVSADSLGQVQFWDGETGSLQQSIKQSDNQADVLDLAVSTDETKVFASGVDSRVICIERQNLQQSERSAWVLINAQRPHTHDVKSLAIVRKTTKQTNSEGELIAVDLLVTGGIDTKLCTYNVAEFHKTRPRTIYPWPTMSPVFVAAKARMVGIMREDKVDLFRLCEKRDVADTVLVSEEQRLVGTVEIRHASNTSNLSCATMSSDGRYLAIANMSSFYLFSLTFDKKGRLETKRMQVPEKSVKSRVCAMKFTNDAILIIACADGASLVLPLDEIEGADQKSMNMVNLIPAQEAYPVHNIVTSMSGSFVAMHRNTLNGGSVEVYLKDDEGRMMRYWTLPTMEVPIADIAFLDDERLAVACLNFSLIIFDIKEQRLNKWSESAGFPVPLPKELKNRRDHPVRLFSHAGNTNKVLMGGFGVFVVYDLEKPFPTACKTVPETHFRGKKRKRSTSMAEEKDQDQANESSAIVCLRYNSMLHLGFLEEDEMIIVEEPWLNIVGTFPAALARRIYGT